MLAAGTPRLFSFPLPLTPFQTSFSPLSPFPPCWPQFPHKLAWDPPTRPALGPTPLTATAPEAEWSGYRRPEESEGLDFYRWGCGLLSSVRSVWDLYPGLKGEGS